MYKTNVYLCFSSIAHGYNDSVRMQFMFIATNNNDEPIVYSAFRNRKSMFYECRKLCYLLLIYQIYIYDKVQYIDSFTVDFVKYKIIL